MAFGLGCGLGGRLELKLEARLEVKRVLAVGIELGSRKLQYF